MSTRVITAAASKSTHPSRATDAARASARTSRGTASRGRTVALSQVARRTGLADSTQGMAAVCARREVPVEVVAGRNYVAVEPFFSSFAGSVESAAVSVELGEVVFLESGRL